VLYLIDGYNVLFTGAGRRPRDPQELETARDEIVHLLNRFHAARRGRSILVFDCRKPFFLFGLSRRQRRGDVEVRFAPEGSSADDLLVDLIRGVKDAQSATVVTSDREILDAAAARGMRAIPAREFWAAIAAEHAVGAEEAAPRAGGAAPARRPAGNRRAAARPPSRAPDPEPAAKREGLPQSEVDYWMREFGLTEREGKKDGAE
jgi:predicted RNA-binding protein with PIN domain